MAENSLVVAIDPRLLPPPALPQGLQEKRSSVYHLEHSLHSKHQLGAHSFPDNFGCMDCSLDWSPMHYPEALSAGPDFEGGSPEPPASELRPELPASEQRPELPASELGLGLLLPPIGRLDLMPTRD